MTWDYNPFAEREPPPMSAPMFTTLVVSRLRSVPGIEIDSQKQLAIRLRLRGGVNTTHLEGYYREYRAQPRALTAIVERIVEQVASGRGELKALASDSFEEVAPFLFPLLISSREWQQKREAGLRLVVRPLLQDVGITLVVDEPEQITYLELDAMVHWGMDAELAYETANQNLERQARAVSTSEMGEGARTLLVDRADGYAATRALLPARLEDWASRVPGELLLGLPHRDFLIGFSSQHPNREELRAQVAEDAQRDPHSPSREVLVYRGGSLVVFD